MKRLDASDDPGYQTFVPKENTVNRTTINAFILKTTLSYQEATSRGIQWRGGYTTGFRRGLSAGVSATGLLVLVLYGVLPFVAR